MKKDIIIMGVLAGFFGNIAKMAAVMVFHYLGYIQYSFGHISSGYFAGSDQITQPLALVNGYISDLIYACFLGVLLCLILRYTGYRFSEIKGILFGGLVHVIHNGVFLFETINFLPKLSPLTHLLLLFATILFGLVAAAFLKKYQPEG